VNDHGGSRLRGTKFGGGTKKESDNENERTNFEKKLFGKWSGKDIN